MAKTFKPGASIRVTVKKNINRAAAKKTLERIFFKDKSIGREIEKRSNNFKELPKRRGGCIWTKRPNKLHPEIIRGSAATITATPQALRDLNSVADFVEIAGG